MMVEKDTKRLKELDMWQLIYHVMSEILPDYVPWGPRKLTIHQSHQKCTGEKATSITKKFSGGSHLLARAKGRRGGHSVGLINVHGDHGALN